MPTAQKKRVGLSKALLGDDGGLHNPLIRDPGYFLGGKRGIGGVGTHKFP